MTNVFVSIDMEGVAGIAHRQQVTRGMGDYAIGRELMTKEANAAIEGSFEGGATSVVVNDSHGDMFNLLQEELDPRAELILGSPKVPLSMMQGFGPDFDVALFIGYHASAGTEAAVLDHTYYGRLLWDVRINGESQTEASLNAAVAGVFGVPVGLVTGDDKACAQAEKHLPGVRTVAVKQAFGRGVARSLHPEKARDLIRKAATAVVRDPSQFQVLRPEPPFVLEADVLNTGIADLCSLAPGVQRTGPRTLRLETDDFMEAFQCLLAFTYLGESEAPRYAGT
jgi:D-amino peptidase